MIRSPAKIVIIYCHEFNQFMISFHHLDYQAGRLHTAALWRRQRRRKTRRWQRRGRRRPGLDSWSWSRPDVSDDEKCWWRLWEDEGEAKGMEFDHVPIVCDRNHEGAEGGGSLQICNVQCTLNPRDTSNTWVKKKTTKKTPAIQALHCFSSVFPRHTSDLHLSVSQRFKVWSDWSQIKHRTFIFLVCFCVLCCVDVLESAWLCSTQCVNDNPPSLADDRATLPSGDAAREKTIRCVPCVTRLSQTELSPV